MKKNIHFVLIFCCACIFFTSCKKNIPSPINSTTPTSLDDVFKDYWNQMNVNYVYWDIDTTNWDSMYYRYEPIFANLNINSNNDLKKSIGYFRQMTDGLIDCHYYLSFFPNAIKDSIVDPASDRKRRSPNYRNPYSYTTLDTAHYIDKGFVSGTYNSSFALCGTINDSILYFTCNKFDLNEAYLSSTRNGVQSAVQTFFDSIQSSYTIKKVIIDVRYNPGGDVADLSFLIGHLISSPLQFGYTRAKSGNGRLDYSPWIDAVITPQINGRSLTVPVIVLADNFSASMAEATTMAIHTLPTGVFIGETTWGATGPISENSLYDDGQFIIPDFLSAYTSSAEFKYIDGKIYEGKGFSPDIAVPYNAAAISFGDDVQLDAAINFVH